MINWNLLDIINTKNVKKKCTIDVTGRVPKVGVLIDVKEVFEGKASHPVDDPILFKVYAEQNFLVLNFNHGLW